MTNSLPPEFAALEPFVVKWALQHSADRAAKRTASTPQARDAFFAAVSPHMDAALDYLDARPMEDLTPADRRLMELMLSLAHVALAVEIQGPDEIRSAPWRDRMRITRATADQEFTR